MNFSVLSFFLFQLGVFPGLGDSGGWGESSSIPPCHDMVIVEPGGAGSNSLKRQLIASIFLAHFNDFICSIVL